ncbi:MAG: biotin--[acetyl-CoA-carboxylase] ligase [Candidatus Humimicrobiaceae bacterium]|jgi:BirA family biotin operon repressor/biotin-[acetyl-CoA-carboxylase] ligase|nr:biotin--[acetyl-CoA-carboxylase] ligase [Candidatus Humimicrobiaceae bacterium]
MVKFNVDNYKKLLKTDRLGKDIIYLRAVDSTNSYASRILKNKTRGNKIQDGTLILAETQEKGRGRQERQWLSPPGGLWFTLITKTTLERKKLPEVTLIAAYSAAVVLNRIYGIEVIIKWPNDLYYKKTKLGGILTEVEEINKDIFLIIGIGINVNISIDDLSPYNNESTSIRAILDRDVERENLLSEILLEFEKNYNYYCRTEDFKSIFKKIEELLDYGVDNSTTK